MYCSAPWSKSENGVWRSDAGGQGRRASRVQSSEPDFAEVLLASDLDSLLDSDLSALPFEEALPELPLFRA